MVAQALVRMPVIHLLTVSDAHPFFFCSGTPCLHGASIVLSCLIVAGCVFNRHIPSLQLVLLTSLPMALPSSPHHF